MNETISITGIDGSGKSSLTNKLAEEISKEYSVVKFGSQTYFNSPNTIETNLRDTDISLLEGSQSKWNYNVVNGLNKVRQYYRFYEFTQEIQKSYNPDISLFERDPILDAAVYSTLYFPFSKFIPSSFRLELAHFFSKFSLPDKIIYLSTSPQTAVKRINKRQEDINAHENLEGLLSLQQMYEQSLDYLDKHHSLDIITINNDSNSQLETLNKMVNTII